MSRKLKIIVENHSLIELSLLLRFLATLFFFFFICVCFIFFYHEVVLLQTEILLLKEKVVLQKKELDEIHLLMQDLNLSRLPVESKTSWSDAFLTPVFLKWAFGLGGTCAAVFFLYTTGSFSLSNINLAVAAFWSPINILNGLFARAGKDYFGGHEKPVDLPPVAPLSPEEQKSFTANLDSLFPTD